jgi:2-polyprenyl-6-hydroxyphenyl methylase/3-demethylubiquinone-9 3-methyltransferase
VDLSESGIDAARFAYRNIQFLMGDVTADLAILLNGQQFDAVVSAEVIEHVYSPRALVANAFRLLKPGGRFIVTTPYHGYWKNIALAVTGNMDAHFTALWDGGHIKFWSRRTLSLVLEEAGFDDIGFVGAGRVPYFWKSMVLTAVRP